MNWDACPILIPEKVMGFCYCVSISDTNARSVSNFHRLDPNQRSVSLGPPPVELNLVTNKTERRGAN